MSGRRGILGSVLLFSLPAAAGADPFADFRIPAHVVRSGAVGLSGSASWRTSTSFGSARSDEVRANPQVRSSWLYDSDAWQYGGGASVFGGASRRRERRDEPSGQRSSSRDEFYDVRLDANAALRAYPWRHPLGLGLAVNVDQDLARRTSRRDAYDVSTQLHQSWTSRSDFRVVRAAASPGWGRVRDATVVYRVHVLEERLQAAGILAQPLSDGARERLAELLELEFDFFEVHDRAAKFFWREVERLLIADGALPASGFDAWSLLRVQEFIAPGSSFSSAFGVQRLRGYFAGMAIEGEHRHEVQQRHEVRSDNGSTSETTVTETLSSDRVLAGPRLTAHAPIGWRWQVGADARIVFPLRAGEEGFTTAAQTQVSWQVADRWRADGGVTYQRSVFEPRDSDVRLQDGWEVDWGGGVRYYLEDRVDLSLVFRQRQDTDHASMYGGWSRDSNVSFGINYRFWAGLDAPGLIEPQRRLRL